MGSLQKMIEGFTGREEKAEKAKENLEFLKNAASAHLAIAKGEIAEMLRGQGGGLSDLYIIPDSVTNFQEGYTVSSTETAEAGIGEAVDQFFSGDAKDGFKTVVHSAINVLFNDTSAGEQMKKYYFVTMEHNTFVRVDVAIWKYYFSQKGLTDDVQQAFCYTFVKSIVDHTKVSKDTIINLVSSYVGDDLDKVRDYLKKMKELYEFLDDQNESLHALKARVMPLLLA